MGTIEEALKDQVEFWQQVLDFPGLNYSRSDRIDFGKSLQAAEIRLSDHLDQHRNQDQ